MKKILIFLVLISNFKTHAQYQLGVSTGNYSGTNAIYLNPSSIADSRYKVYVNLVGIDHNITNNYVRWSGNFPYWGIYAAGLPISNSLKTNITNERVDVVNSKLKLILNQSDGNKDIDITGYKKGGDKYARITANSNFNIQILSAQFDVPKLKATFGFGMRNRIMLDVRNVTPTTATFLVGGTNSAYNASFVNFDNPILQSLDVKQSVMKETSFSFAKVLLNDGEKQLKVGGSFKLNGGVFHLGMQFEDAIFKISNIAPASPPNEAINKIDIIKAASASMHITPDANLRTFGNNILNPLSAINPFSMFDKSQVSGLGFGGDIGVTYEILDPDVDYSSRKFKNIEKTKNKYILKISASINDIGFTKYSSNSTGDVKYFEKSAFDFSTNNSQFNIHKLAKFAVGKKAIPFAEDWFEGALSSLQASPVLTGYKVGLPTNVVLNVDYKVIENVYIGGILIQNIANLVSKYSQPAASVVAILPRYETKFFDVSLPISLNNQYRNLQVGLGLRTGPVFFGTDHLTSFLNLGDPRGGGFYVGATVPLYHKAIKKNSDGDYGTISLMEQIRQYLRKRHLRKLHRKEMKRG